MSAHVCARRQEGTVARIQTVWHLTGLGKLEVELQLLQKDRRRQWRAVGEGWSVDLSSPPGTVIWLPAFPNPDALRKISWLGMEELGIAWGEAIRLPDSLWLCPLLAQRAEGQAGRVWVERVFLRARQWDPDTSQFLALVIQNDGMRLVLAAFLRLKEAAGVSLLLPRDAEAQIGQLLERHKIQPPVVIIWAQVGRVAASTPASQVDVEI
jgi:hypothetical protein